MPPLFHEDSLVCILRSRDLSLAWGLPASPCDGGRGGPAEGGTPEEGGTRGPSPVAANNLSWDCGPIILFLAGQGLGDPRSR